MITPRPRGAAVAPVRRLARRGVRGTALVLSLVVTMAATPFAQETGPGASREERVQQRSALTTADSLLEARTTRLASELRCPVCQGLSIQDSPSELAQQMRGLVKDQLRGGKSEAEVRAYFLSKYGEWILLEPEPSGFNLVAYLVPVLGLLLGGGIVWFAVRRWTAAPVEPAPADVAAGGDGA